MKEKLINLIREITWMSLLGQVAEPSTGMYHEKTTQGFGRPERKKNRKVSCDGVEYKSDRTSYDFRDYFQLKLKLETL
jgi:hypothetical protein